jgi:alkanesulfonate monooxygenase SsuD/methylene tetrahydromethanopterin reductase-like flavin-dependent oxidoreductase (luciferase family)
MRMEMSNNTDVGAVELMGSNKFKLGLFGLNAKRGLIMTTADTTFDYDWDHSSKIAVRADELGLEFLIPLTRWIGFGGPSDFQGETYECYTWAAGIAAITKDIVVAATVQLPTVHPIMAAKQSVTVDHISNGRFAINLVMGWFPPEFEMFGSPQRGHEQRYAYGAEWVDVVQRIWNEDEPFDYDGEFLQLKHVSSRPKPRGRQPLLFNAGNSPDGKDFCAEHTDFNFAAIDTIENGAAYIKDIKSLARDKHQRDISVLTFGTVVCRPTEEEAQAAYQEIWDKGDWEAVSTVTDAQKTESQSFTAQLKKHYERFATSSGGLPIIGDPESVARQLKELSDIGVDGYGMCFLDYGEELEYFAAEVIPLLEKMGLRESSR